MQLDKGRWSSAVLRIMSKNMSAEYISDKMDTKPTEYHIKGELYSKRNPKSKIREENLWILKSNLSEQESLESHIEYFLSFLKEMADSIIELQPECEFEIMCAFSSENGQGGFTLGHEVLKKLAAYPIDLSINLYPPTK